MCIRKCETVWLPSKTILQCVLGKSSSLVGHLAVSWCNGVHASSWGLPTAPGPSALMKVEASERVDKCVLVHLNL